VKPNATLSYITSSETSELRKLSKSDVVILCGGSMDIARNYSMWGLAAISRFVENLAHTNVVVVETPHRFDLVTTSCANKEVIAFNRRLQKILKPHKHTSLINLPMDRNLFTKHGLHLNGSGKHRLSGMLASKISEVFATQTSMTPITIPWKDEATVAEVELKRPNPEDAALTCPAQQSNEVLVKYTLDTNQNIANEQGIVFDSMNSAQLSSVVETSAVNLNLNKCDQCVIPTNAPLAEDKKSSRSKKPPLTRSADFLWS
jgi:hypothetical protein